MNEKMNKLVDLTPVKLKDFTPGQHAYTLYEGELSRTTTIAEVVIVGVGRKYVKARRVDDANGFCIKSYEDTCNADAYLAEVRDWGYREKLFKDLETLNLFRQKRSLHRNLCRVFDKSNMADFTLEELEGVYAIVGSKKNEPAEAREE